MIVNANACQAAWGSIFIPAIILSEWNSHIYLSVILRDGWKLRVCKFNCGQTLQSEGHPLPAIIISPTLQLVLMEHKWIGGHTKCWTFFYSSRLEQSKSESPQYMEAPLYSINGHPPSIAEDRLKKGRPSILCTSNMNNKVINPVTWPWGNGCFLRGRGVELWTERLLLLAERRSEKNKTTGKIIRRQEAAD